MKKQSVIHLLLAAMLLVAVMPITLSAQPSLDCNMEQTESFSGAAQDFVIPAGASEIRLTLRGGDGGSADISGCFADGGEGATVEVTYAIGGGTGQIPPGALIRFVVGGAGGNGSATGNTNTSGGGGGGTAVLFSTDGGTSWTALAVAGGGGGAAQLRSSGSCSISSPGQGGRDNLFGGGGSGILAGGGGSSGGGGGGLSGGGGGASGGGSGCGGAAGGETGGAGGTCVTNGGFGFGGGGGGNISSSAGGYGAGGGGGGASGGGGGGFRGNGGGGGSFINFIDITPSSFSATAGGTTSSPANGSVVYTVECCNTAPMAVCNAEIDVLLDENGEATITAEGDIDEGSFVDCGTLTLSIDIDEFDCDDVDEPVTVTLTVTDVRNNSATCQTTVTVQDNTAPTITCPATQTLVLDTNCAASLPHYTGLATTADNCGVQGVTQSPQAGTTVSDTGSTTVTLTVTDINGNPTQCTFTVTKVDNTPPTITTCPAARNLDGCDESVITGPAYSEDVTASDYATFSDAVNQGAASDNCGITEVSYQDVSDGTCPIVVTRTWTLKDAVGNPMACEQTIHINATPVVLECPENASEAPCQSQTEIDDAFALWLASATVSGGCHTMVSNDATTPPDAKGGSANVTFTASSDCQGDVACTRTFTVTPCFTISGNITWEHDHMNNATPVPDATVTLSGDGTGNDNTDANGDYAIPIAGGNLTLTPNKTGGPYEGVDAADVTRIQQHVTFIDRFDDGYKAIAADVNQSNSVTGLDAAVLFHAINGNPSAQAIFQTQSWRFVDAAHAFMDENNPWPFPDTIALMNVMADVPGQNFVGVKMGDVNGTWAMTMPLTSPPLSLMVQDVVLKAGQRIRVPFRANGLPDVAAWQFALRFDTDYLRFERALSTAAFPLKDENFGAWQAERGELRSVFAVPQGLVLPKDEVIFELEFQVVRGDLRLSEALRLDDGILDGRMYNTALNGGAVALTFEAVETRRIASLLPGEVALGFALEQNIPNPFSNETLIRFQLPEAGEAVLSVYDVQGRLLYEQRGFFDAGLHEVRLDAARLGAIGVLSYTLRCGAHSATRRMVVVR